MVEVFVMKKTEMTDIDLDYFHTHTKSEDLTTA